MTNSAVERSLLDSLHAYVKVFEISNTREDLLAITSSILTFQLKQKNIVLPAPFDLLLRQVVNADQETIVLPASFDLLFQQVVNLFNADAAINSVVNSETETLVQEVHQWRQSLENQVLDSLNAYAQKFKPDGITNLSDTIISIIPFIPLAKDVLLGKFQVNSLIQQVIPKFDLQTALGQIIGKDALAIAQKLANILQSGNIEQLLKKAILGDQPLLNHTLETVTESLVNDQLQKILGSNKLVVNIDTDSQRLIVKQITFTLNIMQASPPGFKSFEEIGKQIDVEAEIFKLKQKERLKALKNP